MELTTEQQNSVDTNEEFLMHPYQKLNQTVEKHMMRTGNTELKAWSCVTRKLPSVVTLGLLKIVLQGNDVLLLRTLLRRVPVF